MISPLLANVYLHYVFDLWAEVWREKVARGDMIVVRYAGDLVVGFQHRADAERFLREFQERLAKFGLEIHPETFTFPGFTHYCGTNSKGYFAVWLRTAAKRMRAKLLAISDDRPYRGRICDYLLDNSSGKRHTTRRGCP